MSGELEGRPPLSFTMGGAEWAMVIKEEEKWI